MSERQTDREIDFRQNSVTVVWGNLKRSAVYQIIKPDNNQTISMS